MKARNGIRLSATDRTFGAVNLLILVVLTLCVIFPIYYMFIVSISGSNNVIRGEVRWYPININWNTYLTIFRNKSFLRSYANTLVYTSSGTALSVLASALCAYPLSRGRHMYGSGFLTFLVVFTMLFDAGMIPKYMVVTRLGLKNTIWAILLPGMINVYYMIIIRTFFQNIPEEIQESAKIDGAGELKIFCWIMLPLSKPVLASVSLFYAVGMWNGYMGPLLYLDEKSLYPVQLILRNIVISNEMSTMNGDMSAMNVSPMNIKYAAIFVVIAPIMMIYPFIQKYFNKGVMIGAVKG